MVWDSFLRNFHGFSSILFSSRLVSSLCTPNLLSHQEHHGRCSWSLPWDSEGREIHPMGVSKNRDTPKRMVYFRENPIFKWMIGGKPPYFRKHPCEVFIPVFCLKYLLEIVSFFSNHHGTCVFIFWWTLNHHFLPRFRWVVFEKTK